MGGQTWVGLFEKSVIEVAVGFVVIIIIFRVIPLFIKSCTQADAIAYFAKAIMYLALVAILVGNFYRQEGTWQWSSIDVLTGFTFLFSVVEAIDNLILGFQNYFNNALKNKLISFFKKKIIMFGHAMEHAGS